MRRTFNGIGLGARITYCTVVRSISSMSSQLGLEFGADSPLTNFSFFVVVTTEEENNWESILNELLRATPARSGKASMACLSNDERYK